MSILLSFGISMLAGHRLKNCYRPAILTQFSPVVDSVLNTFCWEVNDTCTAGELSLNTTQLLQLSSNWCRLFLFSEWQWETLGGEIDSSASSHLLHGRDCCSAGCCNWPNNENGGWSHNEQRQTSISGFILSFHRDGAAQQKKGTAHGATGNQTIGGSRVEGKWRQKRKTYSSHTNRGHRFNSNWIWTINCCNTSPKIMLSQENPFK